MDGKPYRRALRLHLIADDNWHAVEARYYQIELMRVSPRKFCSLVYAWLIEHADEEKRQEIDKLLDEPLPGEARRQIGRAHV